MPSSGSKRSISVVACVLVAILGGYVGLDSYQNDAGEVFESSQVVASSTAMTTLPKVSSPNKKACSLQSLPAEADDVVGDILAGGPFEYPDNDGVRFGNYEGVLPQESRNYYREYTVDTPGLNHRGERRIVTGGGTETDPDVWYYTEDHYETFCLIPDAEQ